MATEGPMLKDGSNFTAYANYYDPSSALAGLGGSGQYLFASVQGSRVIQVCTTVGGQGYGVLQNTPQAGDAAEIAYLGGSKMIAGASITAGAEVMCDASGRAITWVAGSGYWKMGFAVETVAAANTVFTGFVYPGSQGAT